MKRYIVYVNAMDFKPIKYGYRRFKFTAWLLAKEARKTFDDIETIIYDSKKGDVIYEK